MVAPPVRSPETPGSDADPALPLSMILTYAAPSFGGGLMFLLFLLYMMKFATDVLLIAPATIGLIFGLSRIWDAVSDPLAGFLSDRTRTRWGRRRPWLLASALPVGIFYVMAWSPPGALEGNALAVWMAIAIFGWFTGITMFSVPMRPSAPNSAPTISSAIACSEFARCCGASARCWPRWVCIS